MAVEDFRKFRQFIRGRLRSDVASFADGDFGTIKSHFLQPIGKLLVRQILNEFNERTIFIRSLAGHVLGHGVFALDRNGCQSGGCAGEERATIQFKVVQFDPQKTDALLTFKVPTQFVHCQRNIIK